MSTPKFSMPVVSATSRIIGKLEGPSRGPTLIAIGSLHGNEPAGTAALQRIVQDLETNGGLKAGKLAAFVGNLPALAVQRRFVDRDLNRGWNRPRIDGHRPSKTGVIEDNEQTELSEAIDIAIAEANGGVYILDLHTTSSHGPPFTVFADTLKSRKFARQLPTTIILGVEEHLEGTLVDHLAARGYASAAVEGGQHNDPKSIDALEEAVRIALQHLGMIRNGQQRPHTHMLDRSASGLPHALEIRVRHEIKPNDGFRMHTGFRGFDLVKAGQILAADKSGEIQAPRDGYLVMPLYQEQGEDGFFIADSVWRFWLFLSRVLRTVRADRIVHWLPGVKRDPTQPGLYRVNRRIARWFALEVLHLLGFKKIQDGDDLIVASRLANRR